MSDKVVGFVEAVPEKSGTSKKGKAWTLYAVKVDGVHYSCGFDRPSVNPGDYVSIVVVKDDRGYDSVGKLTVLPAPAQAQVSSAASATTHPAGDRNSSIVYQSSRKDALELVQLLMAEDALPISAAKTAAGKAARYAELLALVDKLTVQLFYDVITLRQLDRVQDAGAEVASTDKLPEDDQDDPPAGSGW